MAKPFKISPITAIIIVIGNEILSGKTLDTNSQFIAQKLFERGIDVKKIVVLPDELDVVAKAAGKFSSKCDFLFASGGIGSTPDDITREAFAKAFDVPLVRHPEAEEIIRRHLKDRVNEARLRMADLPDGCKLIPNPFGGAPGFMIKNCYVFPGIPELLRPMFEGIENNFPILPKFRKQFRTKFYEGDFTLIMEDIGREYPNVRIGSYPAFRNPDYSVELTFEGSDEEEVIEAMEKFRERLAGLGK